MGFSGCRGRMSLAFVLIVLGQLGDGVFLAGIEAHCEGGSGNKKCETFHLCAESSVSRAGAKIFVIPLRQDLRADARVAEDLQQQRVRSPAVYEMHFLHALADGV